MKVLDLQCPSQHTFEGWFASEDDFQRQLESGLVECPVCSATAVSKRLSAPRLNLSHNSRDSTQALEAQAVVAVPAQSEQAQLLHRLRHMVAQSEDVGEKFADEARKMHYGEAVERSIRGQASAQQTKELLEEGIAVMPLPALLKEPLH